MRLDWGAVRAASIVWSSASPGASIGTRLRNGFHGLHGQISYCRYPLPQFGSLRLSPRVAARVDDRLTAHVRQANVATPHHGCAVLLGCVVDYCCSLASHSLACCSRTSYIQVVYYLLLHFQSQRPRAFCTATMTTQVFSKHTCSCCDPNCETVHPS